MTYLWLSGHVRNVGDSMLRRPYAAALRKRGPLRVWTAAPGTGYVDGLELQSGESMSSFFRWYSSFVGQVVKGRPTFAFNAGEFGVTKSYLAGMILLLPWLLVLRTKGGEFIWVGGSVRRRRNGMMWPFDLLAGWSKPLIWRDTTSQRLMGRGEAEPDWAFGLRPGGCWATSVQSTPSLSERTHLALALRGDRPYPVPEWVDAVARLRDRLSLKVVCVVQVSDDEATAVQLAQQLGGDVVRWEHGHHRLQEDLVRGWYRKSAALLSDRLHGLIMGATEGTVPLGWTDRSNHKTAIHMDVVGADWVAADSPSDAIRRIDALDWDQLDGLFDRNREVVSAARSRVHRVAERIAQPTRVAGSN